MSTTSTESVLEATQSPISPHSPLHDPEQVHAHLLEVPQPNTSLSFDVDISTDTIQQIPTLPLPIEPFTEKKAKENEETFNPTPNFPTPKPQTLSTTCQKFLLLITSIFYTFDQFWTIYLLYFHFSNSDNSRIL